MADQPRAKCLFLLGNSLAHRKLRGTLSTAARDAGVVPIMRLVGDTEQGAEHRPMLPIRRDEAMLVADISDPHPELYYHLGIAQATGRPCMVICRNGADAAGHAFEVARLNLRLPAAFLYDGESKESRAELGSAISAFIREFSGKPNNPRTRTIRRRTPVSEIIDLDRLEPRELENLCFEMLTQMGFEQVNWSKDLFAGVDITALASKTDPDGYEYHEFWGVLVRQSEPSASELERLLYHLSSWQYSALRSSEGAAIKRGLPSRLDDQMTLLFIFRDGISEEFRRLAERVFGNRYSHAEGPVRVRVWERQKLLRLVQEYPQLVFKYFSDAGRSRALYRKTPEELYQENVNLAERLQAMLRALEEEKDRRVRAERDAVWKDLSFVAAHKMGNPIFALETDLQGLLRRIPNVESDAAKLAEEMKTSIEKAKGIIEQFKSLTKAQDVKPQAVSIVPLLEKACHMARGQNVDVQVHSPEELPPVWADADRLTECFDELIANALCWYDKDERSFTITVTETGPSELPQELDASKRYVKVTVSDNGVGVAPERKQSIFLPFETSNPHGTGLGLSVVQRIIEGHQGAISESGEVGHGATFNIFLPLA